MASAPRDGRSRRVSPLRSVRFRIVAAFLAALLSLLGALGFLVEQYRGVSSSQALLTEGYLPLAQDVDALRVYQHRIDTDVFRLLRDAPRPGTGATSPSAIYMDALRENLAQARIHAQLAQQLARHGEEAAILNKTRNQLQSIDELFTRYQDQVQTLVALAEDERKAEAEALDVPMRNNAARMGAEVDKLARQVEGRIAHLTQATEARRVRANQIAGALATGASGLSFALLLAVLYALRPIAQLTDQVQRLAAGDYSGRVDVRGADEIALLAEEFNGMVEALQLRDQALVERAEQLNRLSRYLASVLDSLQDALFVVEGDRVTLTNPAARQVWGTAEDQPAPQPFRSLLSEPGLHELTGPDGTLHQVRVAPFTPRGAGREPDAAIVVSVDVTEQKRAEERLARSERLAMIGQMLAQITHEVRNPLNALSLNAELLADEIGELDPDRQTEAWDLLGIVSTEIDRLTEVTAHYLQLARRPPARLEPEDLASLLRDVVRLLSAELDTQGVVLTVDAQPVPPQLVDGNQLRQAVLNVVRNAVQAGAKALQIALTSEGEEVRITLSDDGAGMTAEQIERACDPFYSTKPSGTGLGLAITRQILEDHHGALRVQSAPGQGTTVTLALPRKPAPDMDATSHADAS